MSRVRRAAGAAWMRSAAMLAACGALAAGCGDEPAGPAEGERYEVAFERLGRLPAHQGTYTVWVHDDRDTVAVASVPSGSANEPVPAVTFAMPLANARGVFVSVEPAVDPSSAASPTRLLAGRFDGPIAALGFEGVATLRRPLEPDPGAHSLFTTSNNSEGYPSAENAGLWLFTLTPSRNVHGTREVKVSPLAAGWTYEGWLVWQGPPQVWISYGKFRPDETGLLTSRDDTGTGPFAGAEDFRNAGVEDVPGEEWTSDEIAAQLGIELPGGFDLPLEVDAVDGDGRALWHHVISIEPAADLVEGPLEGEPFPVRPYENPIGAGGPGLPRTIELVREAPSAEVRRIES
ncbi:hypothetical protein [Gaopeijia maritima]|uniref:hypothetical protein n=1 Tax=Gaopeijia maritima TaxID=3119007 RepID=UPI0032472B15